MDDNQKEELFKIAKENFKIFYLKKFAAAVLASDIISEKNIKLK